MKLVCRSCKNEQIFYDMSLKQCPRCGSSDIKIYEFLKAEWIDQNDIKPYLSESIPGEQIKKMKRYNKTGIGISILFSIILVIGLPVLLNCYPYSLAMIGCYLGYGMILSGGIGLDITLIIWFNKVRSILMRRYNKVANLIVISFLLILFVGLFFQLTNTLDYTWPPPVKLVIRVNLVLGLYLLIIGVVGVGITLPIWLVLLVVEKKTKKPEEIRKTEKEEGEKRRAAEEGEKEEKDKLELEEIVR